MNTQAHLLWNYTLLRHIRVSPWWAVVGAFLPDAMIFFFYGFQKLWGTPEMVIWTDIYFQDHWQTLFAIGNSIPLAVAGALISYFVIRKTGPAVLFLSMLLHDMQDFLVHVEDAHQHFYPISSWRFHSPISYWDPHHHGQIMAPIEALLYIFAVYWNWKSSSKTARALMILGGLGYSLVAVYWATA